MFSTMLGGFVAFSLIAQFHLPYWVGGLLAILITALFGYALDALIIRRVIGQPQFAVVMLTSDSASFSGQSPASPGL